MKISYFDNNISILESIKMNSRKIDVLDNQENFILKGYLSKQKDLTIISFDTNKSGGDLIEKLKSIYDIKEITFPEKNDSTKTSFSNRYIEYTSNSATIFDLDDIYQDYYKSIFSYTIKNKHIKESKILKEGIQFSFLIIDKFIDDLTSLPSHGLLYKIIGEREEDINPLYSDSMIEIKFNHIVDNNAVIFMDLNNLKSMNDIYGHSIADTMLVEYSKLLLEEFPNYMHFRIGGDEFVSIAKNSKDAEELILRTNSIEFNEKIKERINKIQKVEIDKNLLIISSGGYEIFSKDKNFKEILSSAESKMYINKRILHLSFGVYDREKKEMKNKLKSIKPLLDLLKSEIFIKANNIEKLKQLDYKKLSRE